MIQINRKGNRAIVCYSLSPQCETGLTFEASSSSARHRASSGFMSEARWRRARSAETRSSDTAGWWSTSEGVFANGGGSKAGVFISQFCGPEKRPLEHPGTCRGLISHLRPVRKSSYPAVANLASYFATTPSKPATVICVMRLTGYLMVAAARGRLWFETRLGTGGKESSGNYGYTDKTTGWCGHRTGYSLSRFNTASRFMRMQSKRGGSVAGAAF